MAIFAAQFKRSQPRGRADFLRGDLIDRDADRNIRPSRLARMNAGQKTGGGARVIARTIAQRFAVMIFEPAKHDHVVAHGSERRAESWEG